MGLRIVSIAVVLMPFCISVLADGMPIEDGRFLGEVTVLRLTRQQERSLTDESRYIQLTSRQKEKLLRDTGLAPSELFIYFTKDGENDCTCFAFNLGLLFEPGRIEAPQGTRMPPVSVDPDSRVYTMNPIGPQNRA